MIGQPAAIECLLIFKAAMVLVDGADAANGQNLERVAIARHQRGFKGAFPPGIPEPFSPAIRQIEFFFLSVLTWRVFLLPVTTKDWANWWPNKFVPDLSLGRSFTTRNNWTC